MVSNDTGHPEWLPRLKDFASPDSRKAAVQLIDTVVPYFATLVLMYLTIRWGAPVWVTLALSIPAALFMVRAFILFHDCAHGSFLKSRKAMTVLGTLLGILTFTPYATWRCCHGIHHATVGNLDRRGIGDIWTMTVQEYKAGSLFRRFLYRAYRHPLVLFGLGPIYLFLISNRFPGKDAKKDQVRSVYITNLAILAIAVACSLTIGLRAYLLIQLPILFFAAIGGIWLFYVQHQFDPSYWARSCDWQSFEACMRGSSFYKLPPVLQWFSGNIGLHHIHHLQPRIPNYRLQACLNAIPDLHLKDAITLRRSFSAIYLNLWDEIDKKLVSFRSLRPQAARA
jgi:acyl-lipid omega-6 desaturase (Delta-12 desaturase)